MSTRERALRHFRPDGIDANVLADLEAARQKSANLGIATERLLLKSHNQSNHIYALEDELEAARAEIAELRESLAERDRLIVALRTEISTAASTSEYWRLKTVDFWKRLVTTETIA